MANRNRSPVWRIKVELLDLEPVIWRRFDTFADVTLDQLHYFIQGAMGWKLCHLFSFHAGHGDGCQLDAGTLLANVCSVGRSLIYHYNFGNHWKHLITVEKEMKWPAGNYPRLIAGKRACPPEDCGGPWCYAEMCQVLALGKHNVRRRKLVSWLGVPFNPKLFELDKARERMTEYVTISATTSASHELHLP